jgi:hypothetical protein
MLTIQASTPCVSPPSWAIWERTLIEAMDRSVYPFLAKYTRDDGTLIWRERLGGRDGADDFYESFYNWPLLYLLGGGDHLLELGARQWEAVTRQLTDMGMLIKEYERGYDQFHQSESYIYFYLLCAADPDNPLLRERARRFAGFYLNEDPEALNYDPERKLIRAPHNGSGGPRWGLSDDQEPSYGWSASMRRYGLPYEDVPGITCYDDLKDPALARRMGQVMHERMGKGDVAANLGVTSLITNAFLMTGEEKYRRWVLEYVDAWMARAERNGGLLPDNVGLSGEIGEYIDGKWYGGLYGWAWPHGFYNLGMAATVAGDNAFLLSREARYLELPRSQMDHIMALGMTCDLDSLMEEDRKRLAKQLPPGHRRLFAVPMRHGDSGWFEYQLMSPIYPVAVWNMSMESADWERVERIRAQSPYDWAACLPHRGKEDAGHEEPWLCFLQGQNPAYPETILSQSYGQVCRRLEQIRRDDADLTQVHIHHWQQLNPVLTEALIQLTLGAPQLLYNGGLLMASLRYFDPARRRPGLPEDVAALVETVESSRTVVRLVNLSPFAARDVLIQAGTFGEHRFLTARYGAGVGDYPGPIGQREMSAIGLAMHTLPVDDRYVQVHMPPATEITLELEMERHVNEPSYALPW